MENLKAWTCIYKTDKSTLCLFAYVETSTLVSQLWPAYDSRWTKVAALFFYNHPNEILSICMSISISIWWYMMLTLKPSHKLHVSCNITYTWPISWAIVNAELSPLSSMIAQLLFGLHTVPNSAKPVKNHGTNVGIRLLNILPSLLGKT